MLIAKSSRNVATNNPPETSQERCREKNNMGCSIAERLGPSDERSLDNPGVLAGEPRGLVDKGRQWSWPLTRAIGNGSDGVEVGYVDAGSCAQ